MVLLIVVVDKFGFYVPVQRLALAVPKLSHIPHAESLATMLLQVSCLPVIELGVSNKLCVVYSQFNQSV